jgi:hypothetical protein
MYENKKRRRVSMLTALLGATIIFASSRASTAAAPTPEYAKQNDLLRKEELLPALKRICACESTGDPEAEPRQYDQNGKVLRGFVNSSDIGACQINLEAHKDEIARLGIDVFTLEGNVQFANFLYERDGTAPWKYSASCWK